MMAGDDDELPHDPGLQIIMATPQQTPEPVAEPPRRSLVGLMAMILVPLMTGGLGAAIPWWIATQERKPVEAGKLETTVISFGEVVANLSEGKMNRYLRLRISLLIGKEDQLELEKQLVVDGPLIKNWMLSHLSDKSLEDIRGKSGQNMLRREILDQFNRTVARNGKDRVFDVLFEEFNVQ